MKIAIIGSRSIKNVDVEKYLPKCIDEIISGGAVGVDSIAKAIALQKGIRYTEFLPKYDLYGRAAPIKRNEEIARYADCAIAFWDGRSKGTHNVIKLFEKINKNITIIICSE